MCKLRFRDIVMDKKKFIFLIEKYEYWKVIFVRKLLK